MGIIINHYKDPYQPTSIMESRRVFFVAHFGTVNSRQNHPQDSMVIRTSFSRLKVLFFGMVWEFLSVTGLKRCTVGLKLKVF